MKKNTAGQVIGVQMVSASDGSAFTGPVTCYVTGDGGSQAQGSVGSGACVHKGNGFHTYAPAQAETNYDHIAFTFKGDGAIPVTVQVYTDFPQTGDAFARIGANGSSLTSIPWNSAWDAEVQSECTDALNAYDPPTNAEMEARTLAAASYATASALQTVDDAVDAIKAVTDNLPDSGALSSLATASALSTVDNVVDAIKAVTDNLPDGGALSSLATASALSTVDSVVDAIKVTTDKLDDTLELDNTVYRFTANALEQAPSGGASAADIADAVWEEVLADHSGTAGSAAEQLAAAGAAGDPWATALPGSYTEGQAGKIVSTVGTVVDAIKAVTDNLPDSGALSSLATASALSTVDSVVDAIKAVTDNLPDSGALSSLATAAELAKVPKSDGTATWNATAAAQIQSKAADALTAYDPPTKDELDSGLAGLNIPSAAAIADAVLDEALSGHTTAGSLGKAVADIKSDTAAILEDTGTTIPNTLGTPAGASVSADLADIEGKVDDLESRLTATRAGYLDNLATPPATQAQVASELSDALTVDVIADSVPADGSRPTIAQALYMIVQFLTERAVSGTTLTVKKPDGSTALMTFTLDDSANPTSITRAS